MTITVPSVPEVRCLACRSAIETAVAPTSGVPSVSVDLEATAATVEHDETVAPAALAELIQEQGYEVADTREQDPRGDGR